MRDVSFDAIFSSAFPVTGHLIARRLHRESGIPWVAEYRDPFSEAVAGAVNRRRAVALERSIARDAAGLVMTSPSWARTHANRWDRPVAVITNGYDDVLRAHPPTHEFVLTYLGSVHPRWQYLRGLWQAIRDLADAAQPGVDRVCFIGEPQAEVREEMDAFGLTPRVEITGLLSHRDALDRLRGAGALLLVGPRDARPELRGWIPAKTFEYLASDLPIIFIGDRGCDAARLVERHPGCYIVDSRDVDGLTAALVDCRGKRFVRDVSDFSPRGLTAKLAAVLDEACQAH
jgi:glycosyltransferase involved in cell wall biosynthesis